MYVCMYVCMYVGLHLHFSRGDHRHPAARARHDANHRGQRRESGEDIHIRCMYVCMHECMYVRYSDFYFSHNINPMMKQSLTRFAWNIEMSVSIYVYVCM